MRHKTYQLRIMSTGDVVTREFDASHFKTVGLPVMSIGMPHLEALELVNRWNLAAGNFVYFLQTLGFGQE